MNTEILGRILLELLIILIFAKGAGWLCFRRLQGFEQQPGADRAHLTLGAKSTVIGGATSLGGRPRFL